MGGFELEIELRTYVCGETGKPYIRRYHNDYDGDDDYEKIYDLPIVPLEFRCYLSMYGKYYYYYIEKAGGDENPSRGSAHVSSVLHTFPTWDTILYHTKYFPVAEWWTEEKHTTFKEFLEWCLDQKASYYVRWERD